MGGCSYFNSIKKFRGVSPFDGSYVCSDLAKFVSRGAVSREPHEVSVAALVDGSYVCEKVRDVALA
jgi:hypothetical protein